VEDWHKVKIIDRRGSYFKICINILLPVSIKHFNFVNNLRNLFFLVYDDFKFVTRTQMDEFGLQHLIGTNAARAYMHGYFIEMKSYTKARGQNKLSAVEEYRERKVEFFLNFFY